MSKALLIIDVQTGILSVPGAKRSAVMERFDEVRGRIAGLVRDARDRKLPIIFVQNDGEPGHRLETGTPGWEICMSAKRHEPPRRWKSETPSSQMLTTVLAGPPMCS